MAKSILKHYTSLALGRAQRYLNEDCVFREWHHRHSRRLLRFKNIHQGKDCFIIGNGPSLNNLDLRPLKDYYTFGLNKIYLMFNRVDLNLSYHVAINPLVIQQSIKEFEALACPSFLSFRAAKDIVEHIDHLYFVCTDEPLFTFKKEITSSIHEGYTVTYVALQIAHYMGFKRVFLIGVDHNFKVEGDPNEQQLLIGDDLNHFDPRYFGGGKEWHLPDLEGSELAYNLARFHFNRDEREIFDATLNGKLQIFPKITYGQALSLCEKKSID